MISLQQLLVSEFILPVCSVNFGHNSLFALSTYHRNHLSTLSTCGHRECVLLPSRNCQCSIKSFTCLAVSRGPDSELDSETSSKSKDKVKRRSSKPVDVRKEDEMPGTTFPMKSRGKPKRGRRSEAAAVEDFIRDSLGQTFASIKKDNPEAFEDLKNVMKDRVNDEIVSESTTDDDDEEEEEDEFDDDEEEEEDEFDDDELEDERNVGRRKGKKNNMVVDEEAQNWPLDADVGWGIRASEYFEKHPIKNVVGEDGFEIDWEGEIDDNWVNEINCLEWESLAYHPSPLIVLAFERYNRAMDNWKTLKELEKAVKVYWSAKDRLPPRSVKIDINIEKDLAYALKVKDCPQILFLRGNRIVYREKVFRTADELVLIIAHFYYNAKKPPFLNDVAVSPSS